MKKRILFAASLAINACSTSTPPCAKYLHEFFEKADKEDMNIGKILVSTDQVSIGMFNDKGIIIFCLNGTNANYDAVKKCAPHTTYQGVCRYKDGRFMGYSVGTATAQDLIQDVK